ncbi:hypothetical protein BGX21_001861 [Mortierella sp. AD011]|nr:hypothetical protein BGX20_004613 [Mortierella sp. AD010]KAF9401382.1 hypothetical protein BGX21_001856 [Mortierella sp. AD011]KAF9401387.1 hypothetical protein BGX21_001861 [Mortierella sp. AD011]
MNQHSSSEIYNQQTQSLQSSHQQQEQQQHQPSYPVPPKIARPSSVLLESSMGHQAQQDKSNTTRPRSQSHTVYSNYAPSVSASANNTTSHEPLSDSPVRFQNWSQPAHKSKLSKQYTPSDEDSDDESGANAEARRRAKYMSGTALELNSNGSGSVRAPSQLSISEAESEVESIKSSKKKMSFGKRISKFFGGGNSKASDAAKPSVSSRSSSSSSLHGSDKSRDSTTSLATIDELTPPNRIHNGLYNHQRSQSTPDEIGKISTHSQMSSSTPSLVRMEEHRLRMTSDDEFQGVDGKGHRRYSSAITTMPRASHSHATPAMLQHHSHGTGNINNNQAMYIDQQQAQKSRRSTLVGSISISSPQSRPHSDRYSIVGAEMLNNASSSTAPRRSSTPVPISETLISRVDRERGSVCFQSPTPKKEYTKDANLDPIFSNLVQQHRRDFKTNQRLGGTPQPSSPHVHHSAPRTRTHSYHDEQQIGGPGARRDSNASQHYYHINGMASPSSPGLYALETQMKRLSMASQHQHPYVHTGQRMSFSSSQGSLHQLQSPSQAQPHGQHSPSAGPQRTSPKRLSTVGHFAGPNQYQLDPPQTPTQLLQVSPFPSPSLGAVQSNNTHQIPELSLQQQQQQQMQLEQLQHIRIQQQQVLMQQMQQQQQLQKQLEQTRAAVQLQQQQQQQKVGAPIQMQVPMTIAVAPQAVNMGIQPMAVTPTFIQQQQLQQPVMATVYSYQPNATVATAGYQ